MKTTLLLLKTVALISGIVAGTPAIRMNIK
jgi:hypothetical protein